MFILTVLLCGKNALEQTSACDMISTEYHLIIANKLNNCMLL